MSLENLPVEWSVSQLTKMIASEGLISDGDWIESKDQDEKGDIRLIQLADIGDGDFRDKSNRYMNQDAFDRLNCVELKANDVLIARMPDPLGRACIFPKLPYKCVTVVDVCLIRTGEHSAISPKLLKYWINSTQIRNLIAINATGTTRKRITRKKLESFDFPVPPLAEQQEIVRQLDAMLAQVEQIKARLDAIPAILKKFRQSVLAEAVSGELTEVWRKSRNIEFPEEKRYLYEIASIDIGYAFKSKEFTDSGIKLLRGQNIDPLSLKWEDTKYFPESKLDSFKHLFLKEKDIVLAMDRPIVKSGLKLARVSENDLPCVLVQRVARFKDIKVNQDFLWYALLDLNFSNYLVPNQTGSDIPHISGKQILNYELFAPDIREQNQIVIQVSKLFNYIETIEIVVQSAQKRVNLLTQSILAKAFSGELTAEWREQHQDLITGVNSAEALLAKIQAEREASKPVKKAKKVK